MRVDAFNVDSKVFVSSILIKSGSLYSKEFTSLMGVSTNTIKKVYKAEELSKIRRRADYDIREKKDRKDVKRFIKECFDGSNGGTIKIYFA